LSKNQRLATRILIICTDLMNLRYLDVYTWGHVAFVNVVFGLSYSLSTFHIPFLLRKCDFQVVAYVSNSNQPLIVVAFTNIYAFLTS